MYNCDLDYPMQTLDAFQMPCPKRVECMLALQQTIHNSRRTIEQVMSHSTGIWKKKNEGLCKEFVAKLFRALSSLNKAKVDPVKRREHLERACIAVDSAMATYYFAQNRGYAITVPTIRLELRRVLHKLSLHFHALYSVQSNENVQDDRDEELNSGKLFAIELAILRHEAIEQKKMREQAPWN